MEERLRNTIITVGTSVCIACQDIQPYGRIELNLQNVSTGGQKISLAINDEAVSGSGFVMSPGGYYNPEFPTSYRITAIADGAGALLSIVERVKA